MRFGLLEVAVRLSILAAIPSIMATAVLIFVIAFGQNIAEYFEVIDDGKLDCNFREQFSNNTIILIFFAVAEFSLTGSAFLLGLMKHLLLL